MLDNQDPDNRGSTVLVNLEWEASVHFLFSLNDSFKKPTFWPECPGLHQGDNDSKKNALLLCKVVRGLPACVLNKLGQQGLSYLDTFWPSVTLGLWDVSLLSTEGYE